MDEWERRVSIYIGREEQVVRRIAERFSSELGTPTKVVKNYSDGEDTFFDPVGWAICVPLPAVRRFLFWKWTVIENTPLVLTYSQMFWDEVTFIFKVLDFRMDPIVRAEVSDLRHLPHSKIRILGPAEQYVPPERGTDFFPAA